MKSIVVPSTKLGSSKIAVSAAKSKSVTCEATILICVSAAVVNWPSSFTVNVVIESAEPYEPAATPVASISNSPLFKFNPVPAV